MGDGFAEALGHERGVAVFDGDSEDRAKLAGRLLAASDAGELTLVMLPEVLVECVCVLESFYEHPREHIARVFGELVRSVGVELGGLEVHLDALASYGRTKVRYVDCVIAATAGGNGWPVATFDGDLRQFADVRVEVG